MKRLSDFKDSEGVKIVAKLLVPIGNIAKNKNVAKKADGTILEFASALLENNPDDVLEMFAVLNEVDKADYHTNAAELMANTMTMLSDPALMQLFGSLSQTSGSSASATMNTDSAQV